MQEELDRRREEMERLAVEAKEREEARLKEEEEKREREMEALREQIARDRDEENRQTEQQRNAELQKQLSVSDKSHPIFENTGNSPVPEIRYSDPDFNSEFEYSEYDQITDNLRNDGQNFSDVCENGFDSRDGENSLSGDREGEYWDTANRERSYWETGFTPREVIPESNFDQNENDFSPEFRSSTLRTIEEKSENSESENSDSFDSSSSECSSYSFEQSDKFSVFTDDSENFRRIRDFPQKSESNRESLSGSSEILNENLEFSEDLENLRKNQNFKDRKNSSGGILDFRSKISHEIKNDVRQNDYFEYDKRFSQKHENSEIFQDFSVSHGDPGKIKNFSKIIEKSQKIEKITEIQATSLEIDEFSQNPENSQVQKYSPNPFRCCFGGLRGRVGSFSSSRKWGFLLSFLLVQARVQNLTKLKN